MKKLYLHTATTSIAAAGDGKWEGGAFRMRAFLKITATSTVTLSKLASVSISYCYVFTVIPSFHRHFTVIDGVTVIPSPTPLYRGGGSDGEGYRVTGRKIGQATQHRCLDLGRIETPVRCPVTHSLLNVAQRSEQQGRRGVYRDTPPTPGGRVRNLFQGSMGRAGSAEANQTPNCKICTL